MPGQASFEPTKPQRMKNLVYLFFLSLLATATQAQTPFEGRIQYRETIQFNIKVEGIDPAILDNMPKERASQRELWIKGAESMYLPVEKKEAAEDELQAEGGMRFKINMQEPKMAIYTNMQQKEQLRLQEFMGRNFLIESKLDSQQWKLHGETMEIMGYNCLRASRMLDTLEMVVWFAPALPAMAGPDGLGNLPGTIMRVEYGSGNRVIEAVAVETTAVSAGKIAKPKEGKKVTAAEFKKIQEEKMREMMEQFGAPGGGGQGNVIIRMQR